MGLSETEKARRREVRRAAGELLPPELVKDYAVYLQSLDIPLVRIRGPLGDPAQDPKRAGKAPSGWDSTMYWVHKISPRSGTYYAGVCCYDSGVVLLDIDVPGDEALDGGYGPIPAGWLREVAATTLTVRTCSDRWHLWFRWPERSGRLEWPSNRLVFRDDRGAVEFKARGTGVLPPGFVGHDLRVYPYIHVPAGVRELAELPSEAIDWVLAGRVLDEFDESGLRDLYERVTGQRFDPAAGTESTAKPLVESGTVENTVDVGVDTTRASGMGGDSHAPRPGPGTDLPDDAVDHEPGSAPRSEWSRSGADSASIAPGTFRRPSKPLSEHPEFRRYVAAAAADDSLRDHAIACLCARLGYEFADFGKAVGQLPRRKPDKATNSDYLERTWRSGQLAVATSSRRPAPLTDQDIMSLRTALSDEILVKSTTQRQRDVLAWVVDEAERQRSWSIIPGLAKLGESVGLGTSEASRHLTALRELGLIDYSPRPGRQASNAISVRPLVDRDSYGLG